MNFLCIDTTQKSLYVAAVFGGKTAARYDTGAQSLHSQILLSETDAVLKSLGAGLKDMDAFCAVTGPGSFTGIRIGVTTVRAFGQAMGKPCLGVNSLRLRAYNVSHKGRLSVPVLDAARGSVYCAAYQDGVEKLPPAVCPADAACARLSDALGAEAVRGALCVYEGRLPGFADHILPASPPNLLGLCGEMLAAGEAKAYAELLPGYYELSQAERLWKSPAP